MLVLLDAAERALASGRSKRQLHVQGLPRQARAIDQNRRHARGGVELVLFDEDGITFHLEMLIVALENIAPLLMRSYAASIE